MHGSAISAPKGLTLISTPMFSGTIFISRRPMNTPFPKWPCLAEAVSGGDTDGTCNGVNIFSKEVQKDYGASGQITWNTAPRIGHNQFAAGVSFDRGSVDFTQNTGYAYVNPNYSLTSVPAWQDGASVNLHGSTPNWSLYFTDTLTLWKTLNLTVSGRYNHFRIDNTDRIDPLAGPGS